MNILITCACGGVGRAVAKSLRISSRFKDAHLIGMDIAENKYALYEGLFNRIYRVPSVIDKDYEFFTREIFEKEKIDLSIINHELEVQFWLNSDFDIKSILPPRDFSRIAINKKRLHDALINTGLVTEYITISRDDIEKNNIRLEANKKYWIRDFQDSSSAGYGSFMIHDIEDIKAWMKINPQISEFLVTDFLPGRNLACSMFYINGELKKIAIQEKLRYILARVSISGVTGIASESRLINDKNVRNVAEESVTYINDLTGEKMQGIITVDLKEDEIGEAKVTEINLRNIVACSGFAIGGVNFAEAQVLASIEKWDQIGEVEKKFPRNNRILRDINGELIWVKKYQPLNIGDCFPKQINKIIPGGK